MAGVSATLDALRKLCSDDHPEQAIMLLGYSGWGPGQLEAEIHRNGWLTCDASPEIVFDEDNNGKWIAALGSMGIDPLLLSAKAGR